jgi:DNA polymerase-3 subunit alpha
MAHLHLHSQYSVIDGRGTIEDYLKLAEEDGQEAMGLTDHGNLGGAIDMYLGAKKHGVKPIIGIELYVDVSELRERQYPGHLTVLANNEAGYRALIAANNLAQRQFYYRPRLTLQQVVEQGLAENWTVLSGCLSSPVHHLSYPDSLSLVKHLSKHCGRFFLEVMWHYSEDEEFQVKQDNYLDRIAELHKETGIPLVLTNDCHYAHKHQEDIHLDLLRNITAPSELEFDGEGFHFKTHRQMQAIADDLGCGDAWDNAVEIGKGINIVIPEADKIKWYVPDITGGIPEQTIRKVAGEMLYAMEQNGYGPEYRERFEYEMSVLNTSPSILNSYLVAHDVITWCSDRSYAAAARGSMAGSLVSYLLGITQEDPIKYRLSFGRAVNPARPTIPDFDLDVSSSHRADILDYLKNKYEGNIPIAAYTHYGPKGAFRKILRMENLREPTVIIEMSKALPEDWASGDFAYSAGSHKYIGTSPWIEAVPEKYQDWVAIYQGLYSTMSVHPSGLLVAGPERPLEKEVPFSWIASSKMMSSSFDMYTLKKIGLFKLDVLGLKTLDQLAFMEKESGTRVPNDDYDEKEVLSAFGADLLAEIFQMDGYACREVIKNIGGIETFEDIIAANTLARPGCAQFTPFYRSGYANLVREYPDLKEILGPTNGLILYQEQVMEIARILADFDDAEQDDVKESIKYFNHKNWEENIAPKFRERSNAKGVDSTNILEAIAKMASYTYNRAHAMTYAAIAYKMMWYKVHYPAVYYAAVFDDADDRSRLVLESHFFGVEWLPADVNLSEGVTTVSGKSILLGLNAVKGIGPEALKAITATRPYTGREDLIRRVERRKCNIKVIDNLCNAFALESLGERGNYQTFLEVYAFPYQFLDSTKSKELSDWMSWGKDRLAGYVVDARPFKVRNAGPNHGKEMCRAKIVNINGSHTAIFFPDIWKKAAGVIYNGASIKLLGSYQVSGDYFVESGVE